MDVREQLLTAERVRALRWREGVLRVLDQRQLPARECWLTLQQVGAVAEAIREGAVRGGAAEAIAGAYGLVLGLRARLAAGQDWATGLEEDLELLRRARPEACQLARALDWLSARLGRLAPGEDPLVVAEREADTLLASDREASLAIAQYGLELLRGHDEGARAVLVHGNAGALSGGGFGTALGIVRAGWRAGLIEHVHVAEGCPGREGARLTAWELRADELPVTVCADTALGLLMKGERIGWLIVGAERIAANGDVVAPLGTYPLTVLAMHHGLRVMVAASSACIDLAAEHGEELLLEPEGEEIRQMDSLAPALDVTPADLLDAIVTERGLVERPDAQKLAALMCHKRLH